MAAAAGVVALILVLVAIIVALAGPLLLEAGAALVEDAEIMVRILEIIFGLDAVALQLGVAREALIFFQKLGGVAALAIVLAIAGAGISARLPPLPPPGRAGGRPVDC